MLSSTEAEDWEANYGLVGLAIGLDRFIALAGKDISRSGAFPKNNKASNPMTQAPSLVSNS